jgi:hypothetical protein
MPITMPASTPTCKTTVLVHIIIDPIVAFPFVLVGGGPAPVEPCVVCVVI